MISLREIIMCCFNLVHISLVGIFDWGCLKTQPFSILGSELEIYAANLFLYVIHKILMQNQAFKTNSL